MDIVDKRFKEISDTVRQVCEKFPEISVSLLMVDDSIKGELNYLIVGNTCDVCAKELYVKHVKDNEIIHEKHIH